MFNDIHQSVSMQGSPPMPVPINIPVNVKFERFCYQAKTAEHLNEFAKAHKILSIIPIYWNDHSTRLHLDLMVMHTKLNE